MQGLLLGLSLSPMWWTWLWVRRWAHLWARLGDTKEKPWKLEISNRLHVSQYHLLARVLGGSPWPLVQGALVVLSRKKNGLQCAYTIFTRARVCRKWLFSELYYIQPPWCLIIHRWYIQKLSMGGIRIPGFWPCLMSIAFTFLHWMWNTTTTAFHIENSHKVTKRSQCLSLSEEWNKNNGKLSFCVKSLNTC